MAHGIDAVVADADGPALVALADAARYAGRNDLAERVLRAQRTRFPGTPAAGAAAFFLGRIADDRGAAAEGLDWYRRYLTEEPQGAYAAEALGARDDRRGARLRPTRRRAAGARISPPLPGRHLSVCTPRLFFNLRDRAVALWVGLVVAVAGDPLAAAAPATAPAPPSAPAHRPRRLLRRGGDADRRPVTPCSTEAGIADPLRAGRDAGSKGSSSIATARRGGRRPGACPDAAASATISLAREDGVAEIDVRRDLAGRARAAPTRPRAARATEATTLPCWRCAPSSCSAIFGSPQRPPRAGWAATARARRRGSEAVPAPPPPPPRSAASLTGAAAARRARAQANRGSARRSGSRSARGRVGGTALSLVVVTIAGPFDSSFGSVHHRESVTLVQALATLELRYRFKLGPLRAVRRAADRRQLSQSRRSRRAGSGSVVTSAWAPRSAPAVGLIAGAPGSGSPPASRPTCLRDRARRCYVRDAERARSWAARAAPSIWRSASVGLALP